VLCFGIGIMCAMCVTKQGRIKTDANVVSHVDYLRDSLLAIDCQSVTWNQLLRNYSPF